jgi:hypothetical protein
MATVIAEKEPDKETTQKGSGVWAYKPREPIQQLAEGLEEAQFSSSRVLEAALSKKYSELQIAAQDAVSGWLTAKAALRRLEVRARENPQPTTLEECKSLKTLVDTAWSIVDGRLGQVLASVDDNAAVTTFLQRLKTTLALASDSLDGRPPRDPVFPSMRTEGVIDVDPR